MSLLQGFCPPIYPPMSTTSSRWLMPILAFWARKYGLQVEVHMAEAGAVPAGLQYCKQVLQDLTAGRGRAWQPRIEYG